MGQNGLHSSLGLKNVHKNSMYVLSLGLSAVGALIGLCLAHLRWAETWQPWSSVATCSQTVPSTASHNLNHIVMTLCVTY